MDPRIREDDKSAGALFDKLRDRVTETLARHSRVRKDDIGPGPFDKLRYRVSFQRSVSLSNWLL